MCELENLKKRIIDAQLAHKIKYEVTMPISEKRVAQKISAIRFHRRNPVASSVIASLFLSMYRYFVWMFLLYTLLVFSLKSIELSSINRAILIAPIIAFTTNLAKQSRLYQTLNFGNTTFSKRYSPPLDVGLLLVTVFALIAHEQYSFLNTGYRELTLDLNYNDYIDRFPRMLKGMFSCLLYTSDAADE